MSTTHEESEAPKVDLTKRFHMKGQDGTVLHTTDTEEEAKQALADYREARGKALAEVQHFIAHPNPFIIDRGHQKKAAPVAHKPPPVPPPMRHAPPAPPAAVTTPAPPAPPPAQTTQVASPPPAPSSSSSGSSTKPE